MPIQQPDRVEDAPWEMQSLPPLVGGLNQSKAPGFLADDETQDCQNFSIIGGRVVVEPGYKAFGGAASGLRGTPKNAFQHETSLGNRTLLLITDNSVYRYGTTTEKWLCVSDGVVDTTLASGADAPDTTITVTDATGYSDGDNIAITLDDGDQHKTAVNGAPAGNVITLVDAMPGPAAAGKPVFRQVELNGDDEHQVVVTAVPWHQWTIFTNGVDPPQRYDGSDCQDIPNLPNGGDTVCLTLDVYKGYIVLLNMIEGGVAYPFNVRWSDNGDGTEWAAGDANYVSLLETRDPIRAAKKLGDDLMIYKSKSIARMSFVSGASISAFAFKTVTFGESIGSQGVGVVSANGIYAFENEHLLFSFDGIYRYLGGTALSLLSDKVTKGYFGAQGTFAETKNHRNFVQFFDERDEIYFFGTGVGSTFPNRALVLDIRANTWRTRYFSKDEFTFAGTWIGGDALTYLDLVGQMNQQTWTALSGAVSAETASVILGSYTGGKTYIHDYVTPDDRGNKIIGAISTKTFITLGKPVKISYVEVEASGSMQVYLHVPNASRGLLIGTTPPGANKRSRFWVNLVYPRGFYIRLVSLDGTGAEIGTITVRIKRAGQIIV